MAKASKRTIPESIKKQANEIVKSFNGNVIKDSQCYYTTRYRGTYLYVDRYDFGLWTNPAPISEMICAIKCIKALAFSRFLVS